MTQAAIAAGRQAAQARMTDTCTISGPDQDGALNESTGRYDPAPGSELYAGPCRIRPTPDQDRVVEAGERPVSLRTYLVSVPIGDHGFDVDNVVRVTTCPLDPALVGVRLRVVDVPKGSHLTARRLLCEEAS